MAETGLSGELWDLMPKQLAEPEAGPGLPRTPCQAWA